MPKLAKKKNARNFVKHLIAEETVRHGGFLVSQDFLKAFNFPRVRTFADMSPEEIAAIKKNPSVYLGTYHQ